MSYENGLAIGEIISRLQKERPNKILPLGFLAGHSYRGYYECLGCIPALNVTVDRVLTALKSSLGRTYEGWKGGDFTMGEDTEVFMARVGECGVPITDKFLNILLFDWE